MSKARIHETAVIDPECKIGEGTKVWHFCHLMQGCSIGSGCTLGQNVFIGRRVKVGDKVKIQNNVSLFEGVELEDEVFVGPSAVFTNVRRPRAAVEQKDRFEKTVVKKGATIGANATVVCGNTIGEYATIGAGAVVTKDVPAHALVKGNPARWTGWACECGAPLNGEMSCPECKRSYPHLVREEDQ